jgi:hypothetical protein
MRTITALMFLLIAAAAGCVTVDSRYSIEVRRPTPEICFVVIQWQTRWVDSNEWKEKVVHMAQRAIEAELDRHDLPRQTVDVGEPTMYEGGSWVVLRATAGNMTKSQLQAKAKQVLSNIPPGQYLPPPIYVGKGSFTPR